MVVKYSVRVYQRDLFLTGDTHHTYIQLTGTRGSSDKVRLADWSFCRAVTNTCCCSPCKAEEMVEEWEVTCPHSLGVLLFVSLDTPASITTWYCSKITVITPEGRAALFPCHRFVDGGRTLTLRDSLAKLIFEDMRPELLQQRMSELAYRREVYRWSNYADGLPESIHTGTNGCFSLPREVQFSISKATQLILTVGEALAELGLEGLLCEEHPWSSIEEIHQVFTEKKTSACKYLEKHWKEDCFFGHQFLNGVNPMLIRRCSQLPPNLPVTDDMVRLSLQRGVSLQDEIVGGNIFLVDYERLDGLTPNVINGKQQYLSSPLVLLYLTPRDQLVPIAIQLHQDPSEDNPIFLPSDSQHDWTLAKVFVRGADFAEHELNVHFLRTHLLSEVFAMATLRNLPTVHPLYKLLIPHFRYTLEIDTLARSLLISDTGTFNEYTAAGGPGTLSFMRKAAAGLTYRSICLPDDIMDRGLESVPNYYYRDDGLRLWNIIHRYVEGVVSYYYHDRYAVIRDSELQSWINEILVFGRLADDSKGFPKSFSSVEELSYFVTMVIFTASAQHAAVNNGQFDYYGFMPNAPLSLQRPPPATKGQCSENTLLATLPDVNVTAHGLATVYLLSRTPRDYVPLGGYTEQHFSEKTPLERLDEFRKELKILGFEIQSRNVNLALPYDYLNPVNIENSVAR